MANLDAVPVLAGEGVLGLLLETLLALGQTLVPVDVEIPSQRSALLPICSSPTIRPARKEGIARTFQQPSSRSSCYRDGCDVVVERVVNLLRFTVA